MKEPPPIAWITIGNTEFTAKCMHPLKEDIDACDQNGLWSR